MTLGATLLFGIALMVSRRVLVERFTVGALTALLLDLAARTTTDVAYYASYMVLALPVVLNERCAPSPGGEPVPPLWPPARPRDP